MGFGVFRIQVVDGYQEFLCFRDLWEFGVFYFLGVDGSCSFLFQKLIQIGVYCNLLLLRINKNLSFFMLKVYGNKKFGF